MSCSSALASSSLVLPRFPRSLRGRESGWGNRTAGVSPDPSPLREQLGGRDHWAWEQPAVGGPGGQCFALEQSTSGVIFWARSCWAVRQRGGLRGRRGRGGARSGLLPVWAVFLGPQGRCAHETGTYWGVTRSLCWVRSRARAGVCWPRAVGREGRGRVSAGRATSCSCSEPGSRPWAPARPKPH